ncbi:MAG: metallophosphoesterase family protein [Pseudomonadota bacterium]
MGQLISLFRKKPKAPSKPPSTDDNTRVYAIGDVHGRLDLFDDLMAHIAKDVKGFKGKSELVLLGDYVDRGPSSKTLLETLMDGRLPAKHHIFLRGNHEDAMLGFADGGARSEGWLRYGGLETLESYGIDAQGLLDKEGDPVGALRKAMNKHIPASHLRFLRRLPFSHHNGDYLFVHAGIRPKVPIKAQNLDDFLWIRDDFLSHKKPFERFVVHGHTISDTPDVQMNRIGIDTGAYRTGVLTCLVLEGTDKRFIEARG